MATSQDFMNDSEDINIIDGDFGIMASDTMHVEDIVVANLGNYKQFPTLGVGIQRYIASPTSSFQRLVRDVKLQLGSDGYKVDKIGSDTSGNIYITGGRDGNV